MAKKDAHKTTSGARLGDFLKKTGQEALPVYVLQGSDPYLLDQARRRIREIVLADADPGLALTDLAGGQAVLADVLDALRTPPFLAPRRLVIVREAEGFLGGKGGAESDEAADGGGGETKSDGGRVRAALLKFFQNPPSSGTLCLEAASWNENTTLAKRVAEVGLLIYCEASDIAAIPRWLQAEAKKRYGKSLTFAGAQMLVENLGTDFASLVSALDALALYAGEALSIDTPDVDALVARGHHERVWDLCNAVAEQRVARALELLDAFWTEGMVAPQIVGLLRPTLRQLVRVKALSRRMTVDAALGKAGVPYPAMDRVRRAVAAMSGRHLADAYQAMVEADLEAKSSPNDRMAMETLIHRLTSAEPVRGAGAAGR
jgi:DNA polymerase III subunit delta